MNDCCILRAKYGLSMPIFKTFQQVGKNMTPLKKILKII